MMNISYTKKIVLTAEQRDYVKEAVRVGFTAWSGYRYYIADRIEEILTDCEDKVVDPIFLKQATKRLLKPNPPPATNEEKKRLGEAKLVLTALYVQVLAVQADLIPLQWMNTTTLLHDFPQFKEVDDGELQLLLNFRNILRISLFLVPAARNKKTIMIVAGRLQGIPKEYITGSGQKVEVTHRVQIYEQTTGVRPLPRPERKPKIDPSAVPVVPSAIEAVSGLFMPTAAGQGNQQIQQATAVRQSTGAAQQQIGMRASRSVDGLVNYSVVSPVHSITYDEDNSVVERGLMKRLDEKELDPAEKRKRSFSKKKVLSNSMASAGTQTVASGVVDPSTTTIAISRPSKLTVAVQQKRVGAVADGSISSQLDDALQYQNSVAVRRNGHTRAVKSMDMGYMNPDLSSSQQFNELNYMCDPLQDFTPGEEGDPLAMEFSSLAAENFGNDLWTDSLVQAAAPSTARESDSVVSVKSKSSTGSSITPGKKTSARSSNNRKQKNDNGKRKSKIKSESAPIVAVSEDSYSISGFMNCEDSDVGELAMRDEFDANPANTPWNDRRMGFSMSSLFCCFSDGSAYDDEVDIVTHISRDTSRAFFRAFPSTSTLNEESGDDDSLLPPRRMDIPNAFIKEEPPIKRRKSLDGIALLDSADIEN